MNNSSDHIQELGASYTAAELAVRHAIMMVDLRHIVLGTSRQDLSKHHLFVALATDLAIGIVIAHSLAR